ncbi:acetyltransferase (GNAT) family protein [Mobilisporobacter senegalensis]|uniref:Acetyltransferase (GNAT) family protein n=1 Tax=Mobilisporobacter senegalensis TaxID=1329262 RepID=A0A3N1XPD9_9FIRM|nr:GNAT family N-acetyltransferase [Mobilisporobacter senegalensis]ROR28533.1 acetyltransferase (GNAT) family protein [Mobilisporobacter senegalensis]
MVINGQKYNVNELNYTIRSATIDDGKELSDLRVEIDGETENLDREKWEGYIDIIGFQKIIETDSKNLRNLFLVAEVKDKIVGFSRCEGIYLNRFSHKVEFGVCILKEYWGYGIGKNLLKESINWADSTGIKKITLNVLETNEKAINLYKSFGFEIEGILKKDKRLGDGNYYNTIIMGRFHDL